MFDHYSITRLFLVLSPVLFKIFYFCKRILNNTVLEGCAFNFRGTICIGVSVKIPQITHGYCIENSFSHKYISGSIINPRFIQGVFTALPTGLTPLKLDTQSSINLLFDIFLQNQNIFRRTEYIVERWNKVSPVCIIKCLQLFYNTLWSNNFAITDIFSWFL